MKPNEEEKEGEKEGEDEEEGNAKDEWKDKRWTVGRDIDTWKIAIKQPVDRPANFIIGLCNTGINSRKMGSTAGYSTFPGASNDDSSDAKNSFVPALSR